MSERAADTVESPVRMRERNMARASILDAARRVANREGIEGTSLGLVADEAGVARAAVYAQFRSKNDLFLSIVADDLNLLAQTMREARGLPPYKPPTPSKIVRFDSAQMEAFRSEHARERDAAPVDAHADAAEEGHDAMDTAAAAPVSEPANEENIDGAFAPLMGDMVKVQPVQDYIAPVAAEPALEPAGETASEAEPNPEFNFGEAFARVEKAAEAPVEDAPAPEMPAEPPSDAEPDMFGEQAFDSAKALEKKLPTKGERIRLVGKRGLATPELKETMKRLAPTHSPEADAATETISKLQDTVSKFEGGMADKLERRIQTLERMLAMLEQRHDKADQVNATAAGTVHEALNKLVSRIDDSEKRLRDSMIKMMSEVRDTARRVDIVEFGKSAAAAEAAEHVPDFGMTAEEFASLEDAAEKKEAYAHDAGDEHGDAEEHGEMREPEPRAAYLYSARRAAQSAAMLAEEAIAGELKRRSKRTKMMVAGVGALVVTLVVAGVVLKRLSNPAPAAELTIEASATTHKHVAHMSKGLMYASLHGNAPHVVSESGAPLDRITALANSGNAGAQLMIGLKYLSGDGVQKNDGEAAKWVARSAAQNDAVAEYWLGSLYQHGRGVAADPAQSLSWYEKAAAQGNRKAMHNLAIAYAEGRGVAKDYMVAARWFTQAAQLGYVDSQFNLAVLYERGDGVPQSLLDAYKWYSIAAAQGDQESKARIDAIATQLSADDLAAAQKAAQGFKPAALQSAANDVPKEALLLAQ